MNPALRSVLPIGVGGVFLAIDFRATTASDPALVTLVTGLLPLFLAGFLAAWNARPRALFMTLGGLGLLVLALQANWFRAHASGLYFLQHAGAMVLLGQLFGQTLGAEPEQALCSRIAQRLFFQPLDPGYYRYTQQVTRAWAIYFYGMALVSTGLFLTAPLRVWSVFADLLTPLSLGAMFVGEAVVRHRLLPQGPHPSILAIVQNFKNVFPRSNRS